MIKQTLISLSILVLSFFSVSSAQQYVPWDFSAEINMMYKTLDAQTAQSQQAFIQYYRQRTQDYATPDYLAFQYGMNLWCQSDPAGCQQAANYGQQPRGTTPGDIYSEILDINHAGYMDRSQMNNQGHQKGIYEGIHGTTTYINPATNMAYQGLPINAPHGTVIQTTYGQNLMFNQNTQSWYILDAYGYPVQQLQYGY